MGALRQLATDRREVSTVDPAADGIDYCAGRLERLQSVIEAETAHLSPAEFAEIHGVKPAQVRRWIRNGELPVLETQGGQYLIKATAVRKRRQLTRSA